MKMKIKAKQESNKMYYHCIFLFEQIPRQIFFYFSLFTLNLEQILGKLYY